MLVRNVYAREPAKPTLWESASHVEQPPRHARLKGDGNPPPPTNG